jgi:alpha-L-fucosidase
VKLNGFPTSWLLLLLACASFGFAMKADAQSSASASPDPYANESTAQRDARMAWWRDARFGMFIHWGVYAVPAGTYADKRIGGIGEHILRYASIPLEEYQGYAQQFNPVNYDPDAWVRLAKAAGMKYIVITAKHHDGFALFDSKVSDWDVVDATPYGKDLIAPLAAACQQHGIKLGLYYSQAQDWIQGGSIQGDGPWVASQQPEATMDDYIDRIAVPQVKEILSNYGPISVLWWDTPVAMTRERAAKLIEPLKLQPGIIHNNRLGGGFKGDTDTPEQHIPSDVDEHDWESCMTMNRTWGYKSYDTNWKSTETLVRNLVDIASKGGNYLLNIGPKADGTVPAASIERLQAVGEWMQQYGDAIYGSQGSLFARPSWGRVTRKAHADGTILYLNVFDWQHDGSLFVPVSNEVLSCVLLNEREQELAVERTAEGLQVRMRGAAPNPICSVIELHLKGEQVLNGENMLRQGANGSVLLAAEQATFDGAGNWMGIDNHHRSIHGWVNDKAWVSWTFTLKQAGEYRVELELATEGENACTVAVDGEQIPLVLPKTATPYHFRKIQVGSVHLKQPGEVTLRIDPVADQWNKVNLRAARLLPMAGTDSSRRD